MTISASQYLADVSHNDKSMSADAFLSDVEEPKPRSMTDFNLNQLGMMAKAAFKQTPIYNTFTQGIPGAIEGATAGAVQPGEPPQNEGEQWARNTGKFIGAALPASAAYKVGEIAGAPLVAAGSKYVPGIIGGSLYGSLEGITQKLPLSETVRRMMIYGSAAPLIEGPGMSALKSTGKFLSETVPEKISNWYLNTPTKMAQKYVEQNVPDQVVNATEFHPEVKIPGNQQSLGKEFLNEPNRPNFQSQQESYDWAKNKLNSTEDAVRAEIERLTNEAKTPNESNVQIKGTPQLEYHPTQNNVPNEIGTPRTTPGKTVLIREQPIGSTSYSLPEDKLLPTEQNFSAPYYDANFEPISPTSGKGGSSEALKNLNNVPYYSFQGIKKGPNIDLNEVAHKDLVNNVIDKLLPNYEKYEPDLYKVRLLQRIKNDSSGVLNINDANGFRRILDNEVGNDYLRPSADNTAPIGAMQHIANSIRTKMAENNPYLADLLSTEHRMLNYMSSLKPELAQTGLGRSPLGATKTLMKSAVGNKAAIGLAEFLSRFKGAKQ